MAYTVQQVCDQARVFVKDAAKGRYDDPTMQQFVNDALLVLVSNAPHLFIGNFNALPDGRLALDKNIPLDDQYIPSLVDWVVARAESVDDEYTIDGRAAAFYALAGMNRGDR
jgi:hypothetical protein